MHLHQPFRDKRPESVQVVRLGRGYYVVLSGDLIDVYISGVFAKASPTSSSFPDSTKICRIVLTVKVRSTSVVFLKIPSTRPRAVLVLPPSPGEEVSQAAAPAPRGRKQGRSVRGRPCEDGGLRLPGTKEERGEEAMSQSKGKTIDEELEFLTEMEDRIPRKEGKRDYDLEQLVEEAVDDAMAELRRALPPEELEIYEKCYSSSRGAIQQQ
jgi:hypothetical protein